MKPSLKAGIIAAIVMVGIGGAAFPAFSAALHEPFPLSVQAKSIPAPEKTPDCGTPPAPLVRLSTVSKYRQDDPTRSIIDKAGEAKFRKDIAPMEDFLSQTVRYANRYALSGGQKISEAQCALAWLDNWAAGGALTQVHNDKSYNTIGKYIGGMALAYLQVREAPGLDAKSKRRVEEWLAQRAEDLAAFHDRTPSTRSSLNNHRYWSGLGVASAGVAANRRDLLDWGMEAARIGLRQIEEDGTLPLELARKDRARDYHLYALTPLVMLAELGKANGVDLYAENGGALKRLAALVLKTTDDPTFFERKTGVKQLDYPDASTRASRMIWLEPYNARFPDDRATRLLKPIRPLTSKFIGGRLSEIYGQNPNHDSNNM